MNDTRERLVALYKEMADMTLPKCKQCRVPLSCCSAEYCEHVIKFAKEQWGVTLERTSHPKLPLMGPTGCIAAPHLRPSCSLHTCKVNGLGFEPNDPEWNKRYFR